MHKQAKNKKIRITDIARLSGVSIGTVDRVIHDRGEVSDQTKKRVLKIVEKMKYQPDVLASVLAHKKPFRFIVMLPSASSDSSFWNAPLNGIKKAISEISHFNVEADYLFFDQFNPESLTRITKKAFSLDPDGLLIAPAHYRETMDLLEKADENHIPYVLINSILEEANYLSYIGQDSVQSGYVSAKLMSLGIIPNSDLLIVNISKLLMNHRHILKRNKGFENYFAEHPEFKVNIHTINIENTDQQDVDAKLKEAFHVYSSIKGIFVPSSRVYKTANFIKSENIDVMLIGYDLIEENISFLNEGIIDFLISQKPVDQGYYGIMSLLNHQVLKKDFKKVFYLPIDILTKENLPYYIDY